MKQEEGARSRSGGGRGWAAKSCVQMESAASITALERALRGEPARNDTGVHLIL
jgi:hypothetical protein